MSKPKKNVLVYSEQFARHSYGANHPLKVERLQLTMDLISAYGLSDTSEKPWVEAQEADEQALLLVHTPDYLEMLKKVNTGHTVPQA